MMGFETSMAFSVILLIGAIGLYSLMWIGSTLLLAFCVYNDALYRRVDNPVMWAVLSGFFNIVALIYIIIQVSKKQQPMRCMQCGDFLAPGSQHCQRCGRSLMVLSSEEMAGYNKRRRLFLWLWIASQVVSFIFVFVFLMIYLANVFSFVGL